MADESDAAGFGGYALDERLQPPSFSDEVETDPEIPAREGRAIDELRKERDRLREYWAPAHKVYADDYRFANGEQYDNSDNNSDNDVYVREVYNITDGLITPLINGIRKAPPAIAIYPAGEKASDEQAEDLAGAIRAIEYDSHATSSYCYALDCAARGGMGVWRTLLSQSAKTEIETEPIVDPTTVYPDDRAIKPSFMDARIVHHCVPFPITRFKRDFPGATIPGPDVGDEGNEVAAGALTPSENGAINIWECWELVWDEVKKKDVLDHYVYTEFEIVAAEIGLPLHELPYHFVLGKRAFVDGHVVYYGLTHAMRSGQKGVNFFLSEAANHLATYPKSKFFGDAGALTPEQEGRWAASAYDPDFFLEKQPGKEISPIPLPESPTGFVEIADKFADIMRLCAAVYADSSVQEGLIKQSGEALKQQISQANLGAYHLVDSLKTALHHCGNCYLDMIAAYWRDDSIRVSRSVDGRTAMLSIGPQNIPGVKNVDAAYGQFGVSISSGPSYDSQFEAMMDQLQELIGKGGEFAPALLVFWLQNLNIPGSESIAQIIRAYLPQPIQAVLDAQAAKNGLSPSEQISELTNQLSTAQQQVMHLSQLVQQSSATVQTLQAKEQMEQERTQAQVQMAREKNETTIQVAREESQTRKELEQLKEEFALFREQMIAKRDQQTEQAKTARDILLAEMNAGHDAAVSAEQTAIR